LPELKGHHRALQLALLLGPTIQVDTSVWWVFVLLVKFGDLKIKNSNSCVGPVLLFLGDLKKLKEGSL